ncbi:MAG TPA: Holliday junction branch migration protein RuvA [Actinobacteria bacterium]|nr:Holliday junction branch migration protein RuvA [Actinomycetota bacterium]
MIGRLRGLLVAKDAEVVTVEVGGIGYEVTTTPKDLAALPPVGEEVVLHTHLHVREDALALFGFLEADRRDLFRLLLGVSGVGPRVALGILGTLGPEELRRAVVTEDVAALTAVPGIGRRSAQKLMLELRPRLELADADVLGGGPGAEVREALEALGYRDDEIRRVLAEVPAEASVEEAVRRALQRLGATS